jgi:3-phosphoglycerate kinase
VWEVRAILDEFPGKVPMPIDVVCAKRFAADALPEIKPVAIDVARETQNLTPRHPVSKVLGTTMTGHQQRPE